MVAGRHRPFGGQHLVDILVDAGAELPQQLERQLAQRQLLADGVLYCPTDDVVGIAERNAALDQVVGQVGGGGIARLGRRARSRASRVGERGPVAGR